MNRGVIRVDLAAPGRDPIAESYREGRAAERQGDLKRALSAFKRAASEMPQDARCQLAVGRVYEALGKMRQATEWYLRAEQIQMAENPAQVLVHEPSEEEHVWLENLRPNKLPEQEVAAAAQRLERYLNLYGQDVVAYRRLALLLGRLGQYEKAGELFKIANSM